MPDKQEQSLSSGSGEEEEKRSSATAGGCRRGGERQVSSPEGGGSSKKQQQRDDEEGEDEDAEQEAFDEPDDELEEFDIIGGEQAAVDLEVAQWDEDWDAAGWDDEDVNDDFIKRLQQELEAFKQAHLAKQQQQQMKIG